MASFLGKFKTIKDLFLEKLDCLLERTAAIEKAANATLESTTANLDAGTYLVESLSRQALAQEMFFKKVGSLQQRQIDILEDNKAVLQAELEHLTAGQDRLLQAFVALDPPPDTGAVVRRSVSPRPELALISYLYSFLPTRAALDATARTGEATTSMLEAGFTVYAFEPHPELFEQLTQHLQGNPHCHLFNFALAPAGCEAHAPTQSLSNLHTTQALPAEIGLVRLGSSSLQVIEGAEYAYPVIVSDWETEGGYAAGQVEQMRRHGYYWYIVFDTTDTQTSFYCNHVRAAETARGHCFFFQSHALFSEAHTWCRAVLPATYFC